MEDVGSPLLEEQSGETVTYFPKAGESRAITVLVTRESGTIDPQTRHRVQMDTVLVSCRRHATLGIDDPQIGDSIRLPDETDETRWDFKEIESGDRSGRWFLRFQKATLRRAGQAPARL